MLGRAGSSLVAFEHMFDNLKLPRRQSLEFYVEAAVEVPSSELFQKGNRVPLHLESDSFRR